MPAPSLQGRRSCRVAAVSSTFARFKLFLEQVNLHPNPSMMRRHSSVAVYSAGIPDAGTPGHRHGLCGTRCIPGCTWSSARRTSPTFNITQTRCFPKATDIDFFHYLRGLRRFNEKKVRPAHASAVGSLCTA